ncbi:MAG: DUF6382 domain-containing protein [Lachnospiraceae bacterium]
MEIEYRRTWNQSVMLITGHVEEENYELKMLKHNTVAGLLPVEEIQETGDFRFCYDITGKKSLECYLENNALNPVMIKKILENLIHLCREMERYLLKEEKLLLKEDMIFMDSREEQFYFCYYPDKEEELREEFGKLIEEMLPQLDHENREETEKVYAIYEKTREENYSLLNLQELFFKEEENGGEVWKEYEIAGDETEAADLTVTNPQNSQKMDRISSIKKQMLQILEKGISWLYRDKLNRKKKEFSMPEIPVPAIRKKQMPQKIYPQEQDKNPLSEYTEKAITGARLMYLGGGEERDFVINKDVFLIGTDALAVDGILKSRAAGEIQAKITKEEDIYYIEDMNSANGTLVNGEILIYKEVRRLKEGDRITFADISYRFLTFCNNSII